MAVYCPMFDPAYGWYILSYGPHGLQKKLIVSPLYYYHSMNVKPPVGSKFTQQDYEDFEMDLVTPVSSLDPLPSVFTEPAQIPVSSQAVAIPVSEFDDSSDLQDQFLFSSIAPASIYSPLSNPPTSSTAFLKEMTALMKTPKSDLVSLNEYVNSIHSLPNQFEASFNSPQFSDSSAYPSAKSGPEISNLPLSLSSSMSHIPQSPISSDVKQKYKILPLSSLVYASEFSIPSGCKYKHDDLQFSSTSSNSSDYLHSLPSTSSGIGNKLSPINILHPHGSPAATNSSKVSQNPMSPPIYEYPHMLNEMNIDGFDESVLDVSALDEDDYEMSEDV